MFTATTRRLRALAFLAAAALSAAFLTTAAIAPANAAGTRADGWPDAPTSSFEADAMPCADVLFVGVRGSGETGAYGDYVTAVRDGVRDGYGLLPGVGDARSVREVYVDYPAADVSVIGDDIGRFIDTVANGLPLDSFDSLYYSSIDAGATRLRSVLFDSWARCPNEKWVLGGYSQGALVVNMALADFPDYSRFGGVMLVANPAHSPNQHDHEMGTSTESAAGFGGAMFDLPVPNELIGLVHSECNSWDLACDTTSLAERAIAELMSPSDAFALGASIHTSYNTAFLRLDAQPIVEQLLGMPVPVQDSYEIAVDPGVEFSGRVDVKPMRDGVDAVWSIADGTPIPPGTETEDGILVSTNGTYVGQVPEGRYVVELEVAGEFPDHTRTVPLTIVSGNPPPLPQPDYVYSYDAGNVAAGATITDYVGSDTDLVIPGTVTIGPNTYDVTTIGVGAFEGNALTSVTIPDSVTTISFDAFYWNALTSVTIPESVTTIGSHAFASNALTSVTIGGSVTTIDFSAFAYNALTSVTIPDSVTTINFFAFAHNVLTSVTIGNSVTDIGGWAFEYNSLTSVTIPGSVTTIGEGAFAYNALTSVTIPDSVTYIGERAFESNALTSVTIPDSVTYIEVGVFASNALTSVTIPDSVTVIRYEAFAYNALTSVTIPDSVTGIGYEAFAHNALTSVTVPDFVTGIGAYAFGYNALTSVTMGDSVTDIDYGAFRGNALTSVTIPGSVTYIGGYAFDGNPLGSVLMQGPVPSSIGDAPFGPGGGSTPVVLFQSVHESSGYTTPTWTVGGQVYTSQVAPTITTVVTTCTPTTPGVLPLVPPSPTTAVPTRTW